MLGNYPPGTPPPRPSCTSVYIRSKLGTFTLSGTPAPPGLVKSAAGNSSDAAPGGSEPLLHVAEACLLKGATQKKIWRALGPALGILTIPLVSGTAKVRLVCRPFGVFWRPGETSGSRHGSGLDSGVNSHFL